MPLLTDIVGQDLAVDRLARLMSGPRMPHALLFTGPDGVGRRTTALAVAQTLLCHSPVRRDARGVDISQGPGLLGGEAPGEPASISACGHCEDCRLFEAGSHPDFQLVFKELARYHDDAQVRSRVMQEMGIEVVRSFLIAPAQRSASRGRGKVFVVLEAESMSTAAQNSLLKTLEEPPPGVTIILICEQPDQLLPTTLSRCGLVRFGLLPKPFVCERLGAEGVDADEAGFWAGYTSGSIGRSLELHRLGMYAIKRELLDRLGAMGPAGDGDLSDHLAKTSDSLAGQLVRRAKSETGGDLSKNLANRTAVGMMLELLASVWRDALTLATGADRPLVHADQPAVVEAIAGRMAATRLAAVVEQLSQLEQLLWRNVNPKTIWDNVAISLASARDLRGV
jgi:DNA polymerase-3 subunit delta'